MKRFRGGLVFKAVGLFNLSTLGLRELKKKTHQGAEVVGSGLLPCVLPPNLQLREGKTLIRSREREGKGSGGGESPAEGGKDPD